MGLLDLFQGKFVDPTYPGVHLRGNVVTTTLDAMVKWGRKSSIWPMPFGTACCAIEFMALSASRYDIARFGAEVLRFSPRQADLMFVAGTIVDKEAPVLKHDLRPDARAEVGHLDGRLRLDGRLLPLVPRHAGDRRDHPGRRLRAGLPARAGVAGRGDHEDPGEDQGRRAGEVRAARGEARLERRGPLRPARAARGVGRPTTPSARSRGCRPAASSAWRRARPTRRRSSMASAATAAIAPEVAARPPVRLLSRGARRRPARRRPSSGATSRSR